MFRCAWNEGVRPREDLRLWRVFKLGGRLRPRLHRVAA